MSSGSWLPHWLLKLDYTQLRASELRICLAVAAFIVAVPETDADWNPDALSPFSIPIRSEELPGPVRTRNAALKRLIDRGILIREPTPEGGNASRYAFARTPPLPRATGPPSPDSAEAPLTRAPLQVDPTLPTLGGKLKSMSESPSLLYPKPEPFGNGLPNQGDDSSADPTTVPGSQAEDEESL